MTVAFRGAFRVAALVAFALTAAGCKGSDADANGGGGDGGGANPDDSMGGSGGDEGGFDAAQLAEFRKVIPKADRLRAPVPGGEPTPNALTSNGNAALANLAIESAIAVNAPAVLVVAALRALIDLEPTLYDSEKQEFLWGPIDNEDGYGKVLAYIRKNPEDSDFEYAYALARLDGNDVSTAVPVIWGGGTPAAEADAEGDTTGVGVTLWDFEANTEFEATYAGGADAGAAGDRGRFVMLFGVGETEGVEFQFNVAVFRDFLDKDAAPGTEPADADYFYGHVMAEDATIDFLDWELVANFCGAGADRCFENATAADLESGLPESLALRAAFVNQGFGRGEAVLSGGDLPNVVGVDECWDDAIDRSYASVSQDGDIVIADGTCAEPFDVGLGALEIPTFADIDPEIVDKMNCVAESGTACDDK